LSNIKYPNANSVLSSFYSDFHSTHSFKKFYFIKRNDLEYPTDLQSLNEDVDAHQNNDITASNDLATGLEDLGGF
jgi:hypothetical protein